MMKKVFIGIIVFYQKALSPDQGMLPRLLGLSRKTCMFYPSCSEYAKEAILRHGVLKGIYLGTRRVMRCNPWNDPAVDEVPL